MHAALQIEPQIHRQCINAGEPRGRIGQQVQGNYVTRADLLLDRVARLQLRTGILEFDFDDFAIELHAVGGDLRVFQRIFD